MRKKYLYLVAGLIWGVPGVIVFNKGINAYRLQPLDNIWWLLLVTVGVLIGFFLMFRKIVDRYCQRITSLPEEVKVWQVFPLRGWILVLFMMGLGILLKHIPGIPSAFVASFYSGLGPMLLLSSLRFVANLVSFTGK